MEKKKLTKVNGGFSYDKNDIIGKGAIGTVFGGFYSQSKPGDGFPFVSKSQSTPVAVKRIEKAGINLSKVQQEVETMIKGEAHPNILRYMFMETNDDFLFIVTELCRGTLKQYITGEGYTGPRFQNEKELLFQVTKGLDHLHRLNIVHRDLKPVNILIYVPLSGVNEEPPIIKLADFDISKALNPDVEDNTNTSQTNPTGTKGWLAPEVYLSERVILKKVDIYALGLTFAFTLSGGKHPFGNNPDEWAFLIKKKEPMKMVKNELKKPYSENNEAIDLIKSMLAINPDERPTALDIVGNFFFPANRQKVFDSISKSLQKGNITTESIAQFRELLSDDSIDTLLHMLCVYYKDDNMIELVQLLVKRGADVNFKDDQHGMTPLYGLCRNYKHNNIIDIVKFLIENGADVKADSLNRWTPLHSLCCNYNKDNLIDIVQLMIQKGAEVNIHNTNGCTPLHLLCANYKNDNLVNIVQFLIQNGAEVNTKNTDGWTPLDSLCDNYNKGNLMDIVQLLVQKGAEVNTKSTKGWTSLHSLCYSYNKDNLMDIVQFLIQNGAEVNIHSKNGWTPLHLLCANYKNDNLINIVQLLMQNGAEVNTKDENGDTPLHNVCFAYKNDNLMDIVQLLIQKGAEVNSKNTYGVTPLHSLCQNYNQDNLMNIVQLLIQNGADVNSKDENGDTPLHNVCFAYKNDNLMDIVQLLIQNGAKVNERNEKGFTPLHVLCYCCEADNAVSEKVNPDLHLARLSSRNGPSIACLHSLVRLFLKNGCSMDEKNNEGTTPNDYLIRREISINFLEMEPTN